MNEISISNKCYPVEIITLFNIRFWGKETQHRCHNLRPSNLHQPPKHKLRKILTRTEEEIQICKILTNQIVTQKLFNSCKQNPTTLKSSPKYVTMSWLKNSQHIIHSTTHQMVPTLNVANHCHITLSKLTQLVMLLACIQEVPGSNFSQNTSYPN